MNQQIGITYAVHGAEQVISTYQQMGQALSSFHMKLTDMGRSLTTFHQRLSMFGRDTPGLKSAVRDLNVMNRELRDTSRVAEKATRELREATIAASRFGKAGRAAMAGGGVMPVPTGDGPHGGGRAASQAGLSPFGFMGRYIVGSYAGYGAARMVKDIGFGAARKDIVEPLKDLGAIGFDAGQRKATEVMGQQFLRGVWSAGDIKDYLGAVAEVGSAMNVNDPSFKGKGLQELNKMAQYAATMGSVSQMKTPEASKLLMSTVHSQLFQMPDKTRKQYESGEIPMSRLAESTAGKISQIIKESSIWGKDVSLGLQYALPSALAKGWKLDTILAVLGTGKTAGYPGQKLGRGVRAILEGETGKIGALAMAGAEDSTLWEKYKGLKGGEQKDLRGKLAVKIGKQIGEDPWSLFAKMGQWLDKAEARGIDPVQTLGLSKEWVGQMRLMSKPGFIEKGRSAEQSLKGTTGMDQARKYQADVQKDPGYMTTRLENSWTAVKQSMARGTPLGGMVEGLLDTLDMITDMNSSASKFNYKTFATEMKDFGVHGVLFGWAQILSNMTIGMGQAAGVLSDAAKAPEIEAVYQDMKVVIPARLRGINVAARDWSKRLLNAITDPFTQAGLDYEKLVNPKRAEQRAIEAQGFLSAHGKRPLVTPGGELLPAHRPETGPLRATRGAEVRPEMVAPLPGAGGSAGGATGAAGTAMGEVLKAIAESGGNTTVKVYLDGREFRGAVVDIMRSERSDKNMTNRGSFGGWGAGG